jgi:hypothetical protein
VYNSSTEWNFNIKRGWMSEFADRSTREMVTVVGPYEKHGQNSRVQTGAGR